jgi:ABC-type transporter Mla subunit MlaD
VENGTELVNRSGQTLQEIVAAVKRVTDIVTEIAAASREQSSAIAQVNSAVTQMDRVTQNNAAQTEELSGTAQSLLSHAEQLQELVGRFKLEQGGGVTAVAARSQAVAKTPAKGASKKAPDNKVNVRLLGSPLVRSSPPMDRVGSMIWIRRIRARMAAVMGSRSFEFHLST